MLIWLLILIMKHNRLNSLQHKQKWNVCNPPPIWYRTLNMTGSNVSIQNIINIISIHLFTLLFHFNVLGNGNGTNRSIGLWFLVFIQTVLFYLRQQNRSRAHTQSNGKLECALFDDKVIKFLCEFHIACSRMTVWH